MKKSLILVLVLLFGAGGCERHARFEDLHRQFLSSARELDSTVNCMLDSYCGLSQTEVERLHARWLRYGAFDRVDSLDETQKRLLREMIGSCPRRRIPALVESIEWHLDLCRRITAVEVPFLWRGFPLGRETIIRERIAGEKTLRTNCN